MWSNQPAMSESPQPIAAQSWILELRSRLGDERAERPTGEAVALFVGLFIDEGRLWLPLVEHLFEQGASGSHLTLPAADLEPGDDPWSGAARAAIDALGVDPSAVLRIGRLAPHWPDPALGFEVPFFPCVAAIPPPDTALADPARPIVRLPLLSLASPDRATSREVRIGERAVAVETVQVGGHLLWGPTVAVLDDLLARFGLGN